MSKDEINRLLAEKVMGWRRVANTTWRHYENELGEPALVGRGMEWNPYDNLAQAMMMVADKVIAMGYALESHVAQSGCSARFFESDAVCFPIAHAETLSAAICMAALKVVEND